MFGLGQACVFEAIHFASGVDLVHAHVHLPLLSTSKCQSLSFSFNASFWTVSSIAVVTEIHRAKQIFLSPADWGKKPQWYLFDPNLTPNRPRGTPHA